MIGANDLEISEEKLNNILIKQFVPTRKSTPLMKTTNPSVFLNYKKKLKFISKNKFLNSVTPPRKNLVTKNEDSFLSKQDEKLKSDYQEVKRSAELDTNNQLCKSPNIFMKRKDKSKSKIKQDQLMKKYQIIQQTYNQSKKTKIVQLPTVQTLEFILLDNWGESNYLGLAGLEIFDKNGERISL